MWKRVKHSNFFIKLLHWEYWPTQVVYAPVFMYVVYLAIKARAWVFFSATNPGIELGGLLGESKAEILKKIPHKWLPKTVFVPIKSPSSQVLPLLEEKGISFPIIGKPDIGERGFWVTKIENEEELEHFLQHCPAKILILQEFITWSEEVGILYFRYPGEERGNITSITLKEFLHIEGNGISTMRELVMAYPRAKLQLEKLNQKFGDHMDEVLPKGQKMVLEPIGNHSRGTTFLDGNHLIDQELVNLFDRIVNELDGIYFGRFDIKCKSFESFKQGKDFCILEINGVKAEPTHIYQPGYSIWKAFGVLFRQWDTIYHISKQNNERGVPYASFWELKDKFVWFLDYKKNIAEA